MSTGYTTSWTIPEEHRADPAYIEAGAAIALGQAVHDRRTALGISQAERTGLHNSELPTRSPVTTRVTCSTGAHVPRITRVTR